MSKEKYKRSDFDLRYASEQERYNFARQHGQLEDVPPAYNYRAFAFGTRKLVVSGGGRQVDYREVAARTGLSVNTVRDALGGRAVKFEPVLTLAEYYGVDPLRLFDTEGRLKWNDKGELTGVIRKPRSDNAE